MGCSAGTPVHSDVQIYPYVLLSSAAMSADVIHESCCRLLLLGLCVIAQLHLCMAGLNIHVYFFAACVTTPVTLHPLHSFACVSMYTALLRQTSCELLIVDMPEV